MPNLKITYDNKLLLSCDLYYVTLFITDLSSQHSYPGRTYEQIPFTEYWIALVLQPLLTIIQDLLSLCFIIFAYM